MKQSGTRRQLRPGQFVLVAGPYCSGKSTYAAQNADEGDAIWDEGASPKGVIVGQTPGSVAEQDVIRAALGQGKRVWVTQPYPLRTDRRMYRQKYGARVVVLETPVEECLARFAADPNRDQSQRDSWETEIRRWWDEYERDSEDEIVR